MHIVTLPDQVKISAADTIKAGKYIAENVNGAQILARCGDGEMTPLTEKRPFDETKDWNGKKLLFVRAGGFGDLVNMTPVFREIKKRWPNAIVCVSSIGDYGTALENLPFVDKLVKYPVALEEAQSADAWIFFEKAIEANPRAKEIHMTDVYAEITGFNGSKWTANKQPEYVVTQVEKNWVDTAHPRRPGVRRLVIQVAASAAIRVYPMDQLGEIVNSFIKEENWEIFLVGKYGEVGIQDTDKVKNLAHLNFRFRQSAAVVSSADVFLGNDSAFAHVAGALNIPAVVLFGAFPWKLRTAYSPSITAIQGTGKCSPCFHHEKHSLGAAGEFPPNCPSRAKVRPGQPPQQDPSQPQVLGFCEVLQSIKPERVAALLKKVAKKMPLALVE